MVLAATFPGTQNGSVMIGSTPGGSGQAWNGIIDDIRVYDRVLSANEIQTIYGARGQDGIVDGLTLWYPMNEGAEGTTPSACINNTGQGFDCTALVGSPVYNYDAGIMAGLA